MADISRSDIVRVDLNQGLNRKHVGAVLATGDNLANRYGVEVYRNGKPVLVDGCGVTGYFMRPGEATIVLQGRAVGSVAYVDLEQACYAKDSSFSLAVKITGNEATTTLRIVDGYIIMTQTSNLVDPGQSVPTLDDIFAQISAMEQATAAAEAVVSEYNGKVAEQDASITALTDKVAELEDEEEGFVDILPIAEKTENGFYQWNNLDLVAADYYKTVWYKANAGDRFRITGYSSASGADTYNVYRAIDANGAVITRQGNQAGQGIAVDLDITTPDDTAAVTFTFHLGTEDLCAIEKYNTTLNERVKLELLDARTRGDGHQYESVGDAIRATTTAVYNSFGKKVVWFGTSIPAGCYDPSDENTSYPKIIGERLGLTVYNEAVGGSPAHGMRASQVTADNPYGFIIENYKSSALSLATSLAEKEWLISNWDSAVFTGGKYSEMTEALAEEIRNCSYERKLDKYLTADTFPDAFVFDHGRNDMWTEEDWANDGVNPVDTTKRHSFHQAMNFLIDRILRFRKDAKILIIGHYTDKPRYRNDTVVDYPDKVANAQEVLASEWNLPLMKTWEHTGWGNKCIYTSGQSKSTIMWALPDGLHPHSDTTGAAVKKLANIMTPFVRDNI